MQSMLLDNIRQRILISHVTPIQSYNFDIFGLTNRHAPDIIPDAFQRQQVAQAVSPAEDGKSFLIAYTVLVSLDTGTVFFLNAPTNFPEVKSKNAQRKSSV